MSQVKMVALRRHPFGVGNREKGEEYQASAAEAKTLVALGWAREVKKAAAPKAAPVVETSAMKPAKKAAKKQTYRTRDLKAKD